MRKTMSVLLMLFILISCGKSQLSISDYESNKVKFAKSKLTSNNGEFSISIPKGWSHNEDSMKSATVLYTLEVGGGKEKTFTAFGVMKMNLISGSMDKEFAFLIKQMTERSNNVTLVEMSEMKIGNRTAKTALLTYELNGKIIQEEIDFFIPINDTQYYFLGMVTDKNEDIKNNFGMMIECVKSFKIIK